MNITSPPATHLGPSPIASLVPKKEYTIDCYQNDASNDDFFLV